MYESEFVQAMPAPPETNLQAQVTPVAGLIHSQCLWTGALDCATFSLTAKFCG